jgi:antibiotic biosynthesis monooxygenase (ABM) superfamily enzyme
MNGSAAASDYHHPSQPATAVVSLRVLPDKIAEYREVQAAMTEAARKFPGFIGTEVLSPVAGLQEEWVTIFRLESNQAMKRWLESPERAALAARIERCLAEPSHLQVLASDDGAEPAVAMVFTHHVRGDKVDQYRAWRRKTIAAQAKYPGYLATDFFEPRGRPQDEWIDIVRYDTAEHLDGWVNSQERQDLLKELGPLVEDVHAHRLTGLEGWFTLNRKPGEAVAGTPPWKQALAVLLALYPTVMVLGILVNPLMRHLPFAVQMLISNMLSTVALTWLVMPQVSRLLSFWLVTPAGGAVSGDRWKVDVLGVSIVAVSLVLFVLVFWAVG